MIDIFNFEESFYSNESKIINSNLKKLNLNFMEFD